MGLSIAFAVGLYGVSFGALAVASGLSLLQAQALSALMFTGGSQFGFIGVIGAGGSPLLAAGSAALLGVRNGVYGIQLNAALRPAGWLRPVQAHLTIDESTATAMAQATPAEQRRGFWAAGLGVFVFWNLFTLLGALLGDAIGDPTRWGLDGAAVAGFLGLLWPRLAEPAGRVVAATCAAVTLAATPWLAPGLPIILAGVAAVVIALATDRLRRGDEGTGGRSR